eukprot:10801214-Karenia_brevis.AAC.1
MAYSSPVMRAKAMAPEGHRAALERALFPSLAHVVPCPARHETFHWVRRPAGGTMLGTIFTDGSRFDGPHQLLARNGWAFICVGSEGETVAEAQGVPPDWINDIPGCEAWAILQAALCAEP